MTNMTPEQEHRFCQAAALGVACGLDHRYEWLTNASRALMHGPYEEINTASTQLYESFLAFEKTTAGSPEEHKELTQLTMEGFHKLISEWYRRPKAHD